MMRFSFILHRILPAAPLLLAACAEPNSYPQQTQLMTPTIVSAQARAEAETTPTRHFSSGCNSAYERKAGYSCARRSRGNVIIVAP